MPQIARLASQQIKYDFNLDGSTVQDIMVAVPGYEGGGPLKFNGANVAWYDFGSDFGTGGVANNRSRFRDRFANFKTNTNGMKMFRWWTFSTGWQINKAGDGNPLSLNTSVYADFDMAIDIANELDIYYTFNFFDGAHGLAAGWMPVSWFTNATQRTNLMSVLAPLIQRYADEPRIVAWEGLNECEATIGWGEYARQISDQQLIDWQTAFVDMVHENSNAWATADSTHMEGTTFWSNKGVNFDVWQPHWYPYMTGGIWDPREQTYASLEAYCQGLSTPGSLRGKPVIIGEWWAGSPDAETWWNMWHTKFNGGMGWTLFSERTGDGMQVSTTPARNYVNSANPVHLPSSSPIVARADVNGVLYPFRRPTHKRIRARNIAQTALSFRAR